MLESDLKVIFEYVEPSEDNKSTYSHRIYELLLRSATEFETNCKRILVANGYTKSGNLDIADYFKIENATKLSDYQISLDIWCPERKIVKPFIQWKTSHSLSWYQAYNTAKHDRQNNFIDANLGNLIEAVAGVYSFNPYQQINFVEDNDYGSIFSGESIFSIIPATWTDDDEKYDFDWYTLKLQPNPFGIYNFKAVL